MSCRCKHFMCFKEACYFIKISKINKDRQIITDICCSEHYLEILDSVCNCTVELMTEKEYIKSFKKSKDFILK